MKLIEQKTVVILGAGLTGLSLLRYCLKKNANITVMDTREAPPMIGDFEQYRSKVKLIFGYFDEDTLDNADYLLVSPGVDLNALPIQRQELNKKILSDVEIFTSETSVPVIAVTGSNGKSTVCDALGFVFKRLGKNVTVAGNIGVPVLDLLDQDIPELYVLELSSFQLDLVTLLNASVACILNITEDHLDRHGSMEHYIAAKQSIYKNASRCVYNADDRLTRPLEYVYSETKNHALTFGQDTHANFRVISTDQGFRVEHSSRVLVNEAETILKGLHNGLNIAAILAILASINVPIDEQVIEAIQAYSGLEHRCQQVETNDGVLWINDSKATNVGSAISAIVSFRPKCNTLYLIAGGDLKGANCKEFVNTVNKEVDEIWSFGKDAKRLTAGIHQDKVHQVKSLTEAVTEIKQRVKSGDCVLLSPACASTDMYRNYQERGAHFIQLLREAS